MIKLYLDIDGVLLHTKKPCAAEYAAEFIDYVTANFDCYWLTTHCKGDATTAQQYLSEVNIRYSTLKFCEMRNNFYILCENTRYNYYSRLLFVDSKKAKINNTTNK